MKPATVSQLKEALLASTQKADRFYQRWKQQEQTVVRLQQKLEIAQRKEVMALKRKKMDEYLSNLSQEQLAKLANRKRKETNHGLCLSRLPN